MYIYVCMYKCVYSEENSQGFRLFVVIQGELESQLSAQWRRVSFLEESRIYTPLVAWIGQTLRKFNYNVEN